MRATAPELDWEPKSWNFGSQPAPKPAPELKAEWLSYAWKGLITVDTVWLLGQIVKMSNNDNKKKLHISVCAPRKYKKPCKSFGAEGQRENCLLTTDSIENSDCGWCLSERCWKIDSHEHRCSSRRHLVEDHKMKIGVDFEACLEGNTLFQAFFLCPHHFWMEWSKMRKMVTFCQAHTHASTNTTRDATNIYKDWADFCQCQEFLCHFLSFGFS